MCTMFDAWDLQIDKKYRVSYSLLRNRHWEEGAQAVPRLAMIPSLTRCSLTHFAGLFLRQQGALYGPPPFYPKNTQRYVAQRTLSCPILRIYHLFSLKISKYIYTLSRICLPVPCLPTKQPPGPSFCALLTHRRASHPFRFRQARGSGYSHWLSEFCLVGSKTTDTSTPDPVPFKQRNTSVPNSMVGMLPTPRLCTHTTKSIETPPAVLSFSWVKCACAPRLFRAERCVVGHARLHELSEVVFEHAGELGPGGVVAALVAPRFAGVKHLGRHAG